MSSHLNPQPIQPPSQAKQGNFSYLPVRLAFLQASWKNHGEPRELNFTFSLA